MVLWLFLIHGWLIWFNELSTGLFSIKNSSKPYKFPDCMVTCYPIRFFFLIKKLISKTDIRKNQKKALLPNGTVFLTCKSSYVFWRLHYNAVVRVHREKCVLTDCIIYTRPLFKIFNATSFTSFYLRKQMPHPQSFGMGHQSVYLVLWLLHTHFS